ncbi:LLM class flavin-dependent oxidoreductase [Corynebacterium sputi]|uniref:LLM class flavin-dependent oxidoreductase n=1 Tax=Corynebacterium sputi TaxID=489915 RepID=UPI00040922FE|nr:LLM class flavin-dependent oxidoreductase [Corynebacterium sputi]
MDTTISVPLSVLDLVRSSKHEDLREGFERSRRLAQTADKNGYTRLWYAEHHNMREVLSSATSLLIQYIASNTERIRVGAGGVMLPNHSPLVIAEQFGTLETLYPGRIDLGLGRAPGTDQNTMRALRRTGAEAERFPSDVLELNGYLTGNTSIPGVYAYPGHESNVPLWILGSSMFGATLAAQLGLPYAFASHFAPQMLSQAAKAYRENFNAEDSLLGPDAKPHFMAAANVFVHDDPELARDQKHKAENALIKQFLGKGRDLAADEVEMLRDHPAGQQILDMFSVAVAGTREDAAQWLNSFAQDVQADELMLVAQAPDEAVRHRTLELLAPTPATA